MSFVDDATQALLRKDPSGLEISRYWQRVAAATPPLARSVLSHVAASLMARGWLVGYDRLAPSLADQLGEPQARVEAALEGLLAVDLLHLDDGKIAGVAGLFATRPTGLVFRSEGNQEVHLNGPLAALAVAHAVGQRGEVRALCADDGTTRLVLHVDPEDGLSQAAPDTALFLPAWDGTVPPTRAARQGGFFRDDEALDRWHARNASLAGMPVSSVLLPMAAADAGPQLGAALRPLLDQLPDFA